MEGPSPMYTTLPLKVADYDNEVASKYMQEAVGKTLRGDTYLSFFSFDETQEPGLSKCEVKHREMRVTLCRSGLCLAGALYQAAVASLGGLWPAVCTNRIPAPTTPAWTHSNPPVWCQTPVRTHTHTHTGNHSSYKHCSQLHFQTWITTELTLCDPLPKQKDAPLYIQTHTRMCIRKQGHTFAHR